MSERDCLFDYNELLDWASECLQTAGASGEVARHVAYYLLEGDLLGYSTHGLIRLLNNCQWLDRGESLPKGQPQVLQQRAAVANWDAQRLPGPYVVPMAINEAILMAKQAGTGTITVRRSQHIASLAAYLSLATEQGMMISLMCSTPGQRAVAPFGAKQAVYSPNPFAVGVPSSSDPILLDISLSMTAAGKVRQAKANQQKLPYKALVTEHGEWTDDPETFFSEPASAIAPLGGELLGYKGYGLTLFSELWTMALAQYGRSQGKDEGDANTVWIQVIDPSAFGEQKTFIAQVDELIRDTLSAEAIDANNPVRIPGHQALARKRQQMELGVRYAPTTLKVLNKCAEFCQQPLPNAIR